RTHDGGAVEEPRAASSITEEAEVAGELADRTGEDPGAAGPIGADRLLVGTGPAARVDDRTASRSLVYFWLTHVAGLGVWAGLGGTCAGPAPPRSIGARAPSTPVFDRGAPGAVRLVAPLGAPGTSRPGTILIVASPGPTLGR